MMPYLSEKRLLIFCSSHGQSAIERGFSANKEYIVENKAECSLVSLRIVHDHLKSKTPQYCCHSKYVEIRKSFTSKVLRVPIRTC